MPLRVLLVDDVPEMRRLVRTALRRRGGFQVVGEAGDGDSAVRLAADCEPDIIVLDLGLARLAGREVVSRLRERLPLVKIVVFTGTDLVGHESVRYGVEGYVVKNADVTYLLDLLEQLGGKARRAAVLELARDPSSPRRARQFLQYHVVRWGYSAVVDEAQLVASELVTNAVSHGRGGCELRIGLTGGTLRIEVADRGDGTPDLLATTSRDEHGRGLVLVSGVASAWGVDAIPGDGKVVWADLALPAA